MSKFSSLIACKCPRCQEGEVYKHGALSKDFKAMYTYCPKCHLRYELEIGFFWGAMYIGYALSVAISVILGISTYILANNPDTWVYITVIVAGVLATSRFNFRYGRMILLYMFAPKFSNE